MASLEPEEKTGGDSDVDENRVVQDVLLERRRLRARARQLQDEENGDIDTRSPSITRVLDAHAGEPNPLHVFEYGRHGHTTQSPRVHRRIRSILNDNHSSPYMDALRKQLDERMCELSPTSTLDRLGFHRHSTRQNRSLFNGRRSSFELDADRRELDAYMSERPTSHGFGYQSNTVPSRPGRRSMSPVNDNAYLDDEKSEMVEHCCMQ
eukprot:1007737_1